LLQLTQVLSVILNAKSNKYREERRGNGYSIIHEAGTPIARIQKEKGGETELVEILWWSHREKWDHIGDFGGLVMSLEEALEYVVSDPLGIFWMGKNRGRADASMQTNGKLGGRALIGKLFGTGR